MKWRRWLLVCALIAVAVVGGVLSYRMEPRYNGKILSAWLRTYRESGGWRKDEAFIAVREMGTNAIPFLLSDLRYEIPAWKIRLWRSVSRVLAGGPIVVYKRWNKLMPENERRPLAFAGFEILGPYAAPAVPELICHMMEQSTQLGCFWALSCVGEEAIEALVQVATNRAIPVDKRACALSALGYMGTKANKSVPTLIVCMNEESKVGSCAAVALGSVAMDSESAQKALMKMMWSSDPSLRAGAVQGFRNLWFRNHSPAAVVAPLRASLRDASAEVRQEVTNVTNESHPAVSEILK